MRKSDAALLNVATTADMEALGERLGSALSDVTGQPFVATLSGDLGAGKTTLVRGLLRSFGVQGPIRSPTYTLIEPYDCAGRSIYHLDLYRVADASEVQDLGIRDLLEGDALLLVEWAEKAEGTLPAADLHVQIGYSGRAADTSRSVAFVAGTAIGIRVLRRLYSVKPQ